MSKKRKKIKERYLHGCVGFAGGDDTIVELPPSHVQHPGDAAVGAAEGSPIAKRRRE